MVETSTLFLVGLVQKPLRVRLAISAAQASISDIYVTLHAPASMNAGKWSAEVESPVRTRSEVIFDQPGKSLLAVVLVTCGSSVDSYTGTLTYAGVESVLHGVSGVPTTLTVV